MQALLLQRRRGRCWRGGVHRSERDAVEVGDEGLPAATKRPVKRLKEKKTIIKHELNVEIVQTSPALVTLDYILMFSFMLFTARLFISLNAFCSGHLYSSMETEISLLGAQAAYCF